MRCEVVAVGTELLLGQIVDTNSAWIGERLAETGIDSHRHTVVGDNVGRITSAIRAALDRSDAVIVCGGLGPTQDDLTRDALALVMGVEMDRDDVIVERLERFFAARGRAMPATNLRQADVPRGARAIPVQPGTAPGLVCPVGRDRVAYAVPGVPWEMQAMLDGFVLADLRERSGATGVIRSRVLRTWGHSESRLAEMLSDRVAELDRTGGVTLAYLASGGAGIKVRLTAKASSEQQAERLLTDEVGEVTAVLGKAVFSSHDRPIEEELLARLRSMGLTLATAESVTGGLVAARLTGVAGASDVFRGSIVAYASDVKHDLLAVPDGPVVSEAAALAMAQGALRRLGTDCAVATSGVAGPTEQEERSVGTVCLAWVTPDGEGTRTVRLPGDRSRIRDYAATTVLDLLRRAL